jgi:hypothetical protein
VVFAPEIDGVDVHAAVVRPVVGKSNEQLDTNFLRGLHDLVEAAQVNRGGPVGMPPLEDNVGRASTLAAILRQTVRDVGDVLVIEPPSAEDREAGVFGRRQPFFNVLLVLDNAHLSA